ncbi:MAG TPA: HEPN domain-containing protein, partial [Thermoplasmata archaeon]|nr:HEPN domain-containing protein [Thermoplasmata archaeon]
MNLEECFEKRLLRKIEPDYEKAKRSIEIAENKLKRAKDAFDEGFLDICLVYGYTSMFHSARALLYKDGVQEKS